MSASELSGRIGQSASYINKFESVGFNIPCSVILKICEVCEVEPAEFFSIDYRNYHKNKQLSELIGKMPISEREKLLDFLTTIHPKNKI